MKPWAWGRRRGGGPPWRAGLVLACALLAVPAGRGQSGGSTPAVSPDDAPGSLPIFTTEVPGGVDQEKKKEEEKRPTWYSIHAQATVVSQGHGPFHSPYQGENSLRPEKELATTATTTLYLAARLWQGGDVIFNPEVAGGKGVSNTLGMAAFPNGEATRVGVPEPTPYVARLLYRQTFGLDGDTEKLEDNINQVAGYRDIDRISFMAGKMAATDFVDDNTYSHDPRTQFLNWALIYQGAWDYPANARGYTYGAGAEFNTRYLALRYGIFAEPKEANGREFDPHFLKANGQIAECEVRYDVADHPGKSRLDFYWNRANMGSFREAVAQMPVDPDITLTRAYRYKVGVVYNIEQEITRDAGVFSRIGWNDGQTESWAFTQIDRVATLGFLLKGTSWRRPQDQVGLGFVLGGLSEAHRAYLAAGGHGFILGDGALNYGPEEVVEMFYNWEMKPGINMTGDVQGVNNPGYNRDRGPLALIALRLHLAY